MGRFLSEALETILITLVIFLALQTTIQNFQVQGTSMSPTLIPQDRIVVNKTPTFRIPLKAIRRLLPGLGSSSDTYHYIFGLPGRGSIIVFESPDGRGQDLVKRIIGIPGDRVLMKDGRVFINGKHEAEPYLRSQGSSDMAELLVPENHYFVLGDNRPWSNDSRHWTFKFIEESLIIGKAWVVYWPRERTSILRNQPSIEN